MFRFRRLRRLDSSDLLTSRLFNQDTFYEALLKDMRNCTRELIIESPFITTRRIATLLPTFKKLRKRGVNIIINTREPAEHNDIYRHQAEDAIAAFQEIGITVLYTAGHHRKIVILDRSILWEGSLNVLSQNDTCELMRRIDSLPLAQQMIDFLHIKRYLVQ